MRAKEEAFRILEGALSIASSGVDDAEVAISGGDFESTRFADNRILPAVERGVELMSVRISIEGRIARGVTSDLSSGGVRTAVQQLKSQVEHLPETAQGFGFAGPQTYQETDAYDPETDALRALDRERLAGQAILTGLRNRLSASGVIDVQRGAFDVHGHPSTYAVANTRGLLAYHPQTKVSLRYEMRAADGTAGWAEDAAFTLAALEPEDLVQSTVARASRRQAPRAVPPGNYPVVLEPAVVGRLVQCLGRHVGGSAAATGPSFLAGAAGREVAPPEIFLYDDHTHPLHRGGPFDDEGVARTRVTIIDAGRTADPVYSWASAQRYSAEPTGHRVFDQWGLEREWAQHLVLEGDTKTGGDLLGDLEHGLLVTRLGPVATTDPRAVAITGSTQHGLFLVEDGEVVAPVDDMQLRGSVLDILRDTAGRSGACWAAGAVVPSLLTRLTMTAPAY